MFTGNARQRLIVALDCESSALALDLVDRLGDRVSFYKVGWRLFVSGGMELVRELRIEEKEVFLDLKMDDIGETIQGAVRNIAEEDIRFLTIQGTAATARAAKAGRGDGAYPKLLSVTLLSSLDEQDLRDLFFATTGKSDMPLLMNYVKHRARQALESGCDGLIASGETIGELRKEFPEALIVSPGIRPSGAAHDDHKRAMSPKDAILAGADYLVVGRPIRLHPHPVEATDSILSEMDEAIKSRSQSH